MRLIARWDWRLVLLVVLTVALDLAAGYQSVAHAVFPAPIAVFSDLMNTSLRLLFPIVIALLAGTHIAGELAHHHIASTRTRQDIRWYLTARLLQAAALCFAVFAAVTAINGVFGFGVLPALLPDLVDPHQYGLGTPAAIDAFTAAPLTPVERAGIPLFIAVAAIWAGSNAAVFAVLTVVAVLTIQQRALALLIPLAVYMLESIVLQIQQLPGASFLISALYPSGLSRYPLAVAVAPTVILAAVVSAVAVYVILTSRTNHRFS